MTTEKNNQGPTYTIAYRSSAGDKLAEIDHLVLGDESDGVSATGPFQRDHYAAAGLVALVQAGELTQAAAGALVRTTSFASERIEIDSTRRTPVSLLASAMTEIATSARNPGSTRSIAHRAKQHWSVLRAVGKPEL